MFTNRLARRVGTATLGIAMALALATPFVLAGSPAGASGVKTTTTSYAATTDGTPTFTCGSGVLSGSTCTSTMSMNKSYCASPMGGTYNTATNQCTFSYYATELSGYSCPKGGVLTPSNQLNWNGPVTCVVTTTVKTVTKAPAKHKAAKPKKK